MIRDGSGEASFKQVAPPKADDAGIRTL